MVILLGRMCQQSEGNLEHLLKIFKMISTPMAELNNEFSLKQWDPF